jgi:probable rRNA maturation factor
MSVFVGNEQSDHPVDEPSLAELARLVMDAEGVGEAELSILLVDRGYMTDMHQRFMGERRATDVLAFPMDGPVPASGPPPGPTGPRGHTGGRYVADVEDDDYDDEEDEDDDLPWVLGDVVLCPDYAAEQASRAGQSLARELELLTVHGILHLCGLDHAEPEEERVMKARTEELLAQWRAQPTPGDGTGGDRTSDPSADGVADV